MKFLKTMKTPFSQMNIQHQISQTYTYIYLQFLYWNVIFFEGVKGIRNVPGVVLEYCAGSQSRVILGGIKGTGRTWNGLGSSFIGY